MDRAALPEPGLVERFAADLDQLVEPGRTLGVAVSGGPDSLALLLLAAAARPGKVEAATVDHRLRPESRTEAEMVAGLCRRLGIAHSILTLEWDKPARSNLQAAAREGRYRLLGRWAAERELAAVATAHHADDQAETLLMRLARGAGLSGLRGIRRRRALDPGPLLVRPLLGWRRLELAGLVAAAGLAPVDDPSNRDPRHDRARIRSLLAQSNVAEWADPGRLAASADWLAEADEALDWALDRLAEDRLEAMAGAVTIRSEGVPRELQRRLLLAAFDRLGAQRPRGPELDRARRALAAGKPATLSGLKLDPGPPWRLSPAPPRRG